MEKKLTEQEMWAEMARMQKDMNENILKTISTSLIALKTAQKGLKEANKPIVEIGKQADSFSRFLKLLNRKATNGTDHQRNLDGNALQHALHKEAVGINKAHRD